ncbi:hypothetical protein K8942_02265 [Candidatus Peribacteria bacterium]|nr:MAG: hypothetical protein K8942_02265 [Candidatus Peribacteria bacterium]
MSAPQNNGGVQWGWLDWFLLAVAMILFGFLVLPVWRAKSESVDFGKFIMTMLACYGLVIAGWVLIRKGESHAGNVSIEELIGAVMIAAGTLFFACAICPGAVHSILKVTSIVQQPDIDPPELLVTPVMTGTPPAVTGKELNFALPAPEPDKIIIQIEVPGDTDKLVIPARRGKAWYHYNADATKGLKARDSLYTAF